ncbi:NAD(P)-dependent oxidoreductase [Polluticoccus soli]|uniref:NAD(P)-dependent oxidoreductase n=1 Tax=Polluticoccus soli TaxID=3034150 RepID=UPI0023E17A10|nr:NAD(P)-dependent oxidoreductase [Flavipsychrobacter sp. JY13-12]
MTNQGKVLIAAPVHEVLVKGLENAGYRCIIEEKINQEKAFPLIVDCVGVITSTRLQLDKQLLDAAPLLKWIGRMGSGMEVIDLAYAVKKGVACYSSPEGNCNAVAEHALGMLISLKRHIVTSNEEVQNGQWLREENRGVELEGKTIGIIGFGHTGRAFARKLQNFDMNIFAYDKYDANNFPSYVTNCDTLEPIYKQADIISFHVPLQADTRHYFNAEFAGKMLHPFVLLNTSRGSVVDSKSLLDGLLSQKITGVCLDVFEQEPPRNMSPEVAQIFEQIIKMPQVIVTPHIAGYSFEALFKMSKVLLDKIVIAP